MTFTVPEPEPVLPVVTAAHWASLVAFHAQPDRADTLNAALPPAGPMAEGGAEMPYVHAVSPALLRHFTYMLLQ